LSLLRHLYKTTELLKFTTSIISRTSSVSHSSHIPFKPLIVALYLISISDNLSHNTMAQVDPDQFTTPFMVTPTKRRDPYPALDPSKPSNSQKGKIIIITGASSGLGAVRDYNKYYINLTQLTFSRLLQESGLVQAQRVLLSLHAGSMLLRKLPESSGKSVHHPRSWLRK